MTTGSGVSHSTLRFSEVNRGCPQEGLQAVSACIILVAPSVRKDASGQEGHLRVAAAVKLRCSSGQVAQAGGQETVCPGGAHGSLRTSAGALNQAAPPEVRLPDHEWGVAEVGSFGGDTVHLCNDEGARKLPSGLEGSVHFRYQDDGFRSGFECVTHARDCPKDVYDDDSAVRTVAYL
jgi:hypothetical protein